MTTIECTASTSGCDHGAAEELRLVGDVSRRVYRLCPGCRAVYGGAPFGMTFVAASAPEWRIRAAEQRLPSKTYGAQVI